MLPASTERYARDYEVQRIFAAIDWTIFAAAL
jgi:hypothetical protein